ncbi:NIPSNAP family protein [Pseudomonas panipatensis]|uniref:NIPSNAP protein n=1 Tax=Pseudomonas panipatensis TaxID=428992 RepID=A0A1G8GD99_9PSED|nr:NIPSNAP family protein [Pseudomonas panipatensis]SDH92310.1 NIPSNAP protein [Pseudomonas panipatensis]SMP44098.1 NIPSNAP protein [Pseudomonas panipatensis]
MNVIDHRLYTIRPRGMAEFLEIFDRLALPVLRRHLGEPLGFYVSSIGPLNQVLHLWGYQSLDDFERRSAARDADPDFPAYLQASAHLVIAQETRILRPADLPSLR